MAFEGARSTAGFTPAGRDVSGAMKAIPRRSGPVRLKQRVYYQHAMLLSGTSIWDHSGERKPQTPSTLEPVPGLANVSTEPRLNYSLVHAAEE